MVRCFLQFQNYLTPKNLNSVQLYQFYMSINKPQPERFEVYNLLADGKSFTIKDSKFVFKLDQHGGWKDQFGHYYNCNGQPDIQPQDADLTPQEVSSQESDEMDNDYDKLYGGDIQEDQEETTQHLNIRVLESISKNMQILSTYPINKKIRIRFSNMPYKLMPKAVYQAYSSKVKGIDNIIFDLNKEKKRNGEGYFIMNSVESAQLLVKLEGEKVTERQVYFKVESLEQLLMDPIKESELRNQWSVNTSSKIPQFFNSKKQQIEDQLIKQTEKKEEAPEANSQQKKLVQKGQKTDKKKFTAKTQVKQQAKPQSSSQLQQFVNCELNFEIFETKTRFVNWMTENKAIRDIDYKNINKEQIDGKTIVTMDVKRSIVEACNGKTYEGAIVKFKPTSK